MTRRLASIQTILELNPIEGADSIETASILGWKVVVRKEEFKVGDSVVYVEVDSILPPRDEFAFLAERKYKVKTVRLRGQISQGIVFPLSIVPESFWAESHEDMGDVTEALGIIKWEPAVPASLSGQVIGPIPSFIPKTDEIRLQANPWILDTYVDGERFFVGTEKLDGASTTLFVQDGKLHCCSRNLDLHEDSKNSIWSVARRDSFQDRMETVGAAGTIALQGEIVGPGIQGNRLKLPRTEVYFFNAYDYTTGEYLSYIDFVDLITDLKFKCVPLIYAHPLNAETIDSMIERSNRNSAVSDYPVPMEGIVWRPTVEVKDQNIGRLSFKVINNQYLLRWSN